MITLIKNEIIKLIFRRKTLVTLIAFIVLIILIAFGLYKENELMARNQDPKYRIQEIQSNIDRLGNRINSNRTSEDEKLMYENNIKSLQAEIQKIKDNPAPVQTDWKETLKTDIQNIQKNLQSTTISARMKEQNRKQLTIAQYLLRNNIKPMEDYEFNGANYLQTLFKTLGMIFLAVGVAIFLSDMVSGEYTPPTAKFLLIQPISRAKILFSKYITSILSAVVLICGIELIAFALIGIFTGFGNMNYPVLVGERFQYDLSYVNQFGGHDLISIAGTAHMVPMFKYLIEAFLLQILFIIACTTFVFMISTVSKSSMIAMSVSIAAIIAVSALQNVATITKEITSFIFIIYGDVNAVLSGGAAMTLGLTYPTTAFIILILIIWTIASYLIAHFVFVKRDILI
ncbi:ABC transporter permease [Clostridium sp. WILCCON 0269]|uniref:ABC transporter permease n=1 Tax=Candidatus Clostridium eludens TaxID=3381663 RepID=A0ABW8SRH5_9CLOT